MGLQIRITLPEGISGAAYGREIARRLQNAAQDILSGTPPERYLEAVTRYEVLKELVAFAEERVAAVAKGEIKDND